MGKGSSQRPTDKNAFDNNYDAIFGKKGAFKEKVVRNKKISIDRTITSLEELSMGASSSDVQEVYDDAIELLHQYRDLHD